MSQYSDTEKKFYMGKKNHSLNLKSRYLDYLSTLHPSLQILFANVTEIVSSNFSVYQRDATTYYYEDI